MWENQFENYKEQQYKSYLADEDIKEDKNRDDIFPLKQFIEATHVKFLESAGARVIPIDYTLDEDKIKEILNQINGLYIPGDSPSLVTDGNWDFTKTVRKILKWSQQHNELESSHFPILGVGYGTLAMMRSQM